MQEEGTSCPFWQPPCQLVGLWPRPSPLVTLQTQPGQWSPSCGLLNVDTIYSRPPVYSGTIFSLHAHVPDHWLQFLYVPPVPQRIVSWLPTDCRPALVWANVPAIQWLQSQPWEGGPLSYLSLLRYSPSALRYHREFSSFFKCSFIKNLKIFILNFPYLNHSMVMFTSGRYKPG